MENLNLSRLIKNQLPLLNRIVGANQISQTNNKQKKKEKNNEEVIFYFNSRPIICIHIM